MIPYFGAIIAGVFCALIDLISDGVWKAVLVAVFILAMQQIDGNILQPRIVSHSIGVRPIYVLLAITVGGGLFGFWGIFLGVPVMATVQMLLNDINAYRNRPRGGSTPLPAGGPSEDSGGVPPEPDIPAEEAPPAEDTPPPEEETL